jgi:hypothetical protein
LAVSRCASSCTVDTAELELILPKFRGEILKRQTHMAALDVTPRTQSQVQAMATHWSEWAAAHEELLLELDSSWDATVLPAPFLWGLGASAG